MAGFGDQLQRVRNIGKNNNNNNNKTKQKPRLGSWSTAYLSGF